MSVLIEPAAPPRHFAFRPAAVDLGLQVGVDARNRFSHLRPDRRLFDRFAQHRFIVTMPAT
jgi:hypothetical protein